MVEIQLGVVLGSGKLAVAEQLLHSADVAGVLQQMAGVAVAQHMGAEMSAAMVGGELLQAFLDLARAEAAAGAAGKEGGFAGRGGAGFQVAFSRRLLCLHGDLTLRITRKTFHRFNNIISISHKNSPSAKSIWVPNIKVIYQASVRLH